MSNPKKLINTSKIEAKKLMIDNIETIAAAMIKDIIKNYRNSNPSQYYKAVNGVEPKGINKYKNDLKIFFGNLARASINQAKKEVPSNIKFAEYEKLPAKVRNRIEMRSNLLIGAQIADIQKQVFFDYANNVIATDSEAALEDAMVNGGSAMIRGPTVITGAQAAVSSIVNEARQAYFFEDDVYEQIQAFKYVNDVPVSDICTELNGHIFDKDDPDLQKYQPPLHFNCDGYFLPILITQKKPETSKFIPSKAAQKSIKFSEGCSCHNEIPQARWVLLCNDNSVLWDQKPLEIKFQEDNMPEVKTPREGNLQSIIVSKDKAKSLDEAKKIAKDVGATHLQADETDSSYRFRQRNPTDFVKSSFRSKPIEQKGVTLIYGQLK